MNAVPGLVIAAPQSGSGKTLITLGLLAALKARGTEVASAKVGPDYIDPAFHAAATGRECLTLDLWSMRPGLIARLVSLPSGGAELLIVEGVMGMFDGPARGAGSTADMAACLGLPIVLVVDCARQSGSIAALVHGFSSFDARITVAGVILTRVASDRHEHLLREALLRTGHHCFGVIRTDPALTLPSRHLGLVQAGEHPNLKAFIDRAASAVTTSIDLDALIEIARVPVSGEVPYEPALPPLGQRIAVAMDAAFSFAYPHLLQGWRQQGADVLPFSPLTDEAPSQTADAVYLPGGYPELHAGRLAANTGFREGMCRAAEAGSLIYGECGGYMVLGRSLIDAECVSHEMLGLLPQVTSFAQRKRQLGYREIEVLSPSPLPWPTRLAGHEFHYASEIETGGHPAFRAADAMGADLGPCGAAAGRIIGSFLHVIDARSVSTGVETMAAE